MRYIYLLIGLILGVHKRDKWFTIPIRKPGWPVESWTYKRCSGQQWIWRIYGNDREGCEPWFKGRQWGFWEWFLRNPANNAGYHWFGYVWWEEGNPLASVRRDHLERKYIRNTKHFMLSLVRPLHRNWIWWRPFIWIRLLRDPAWKWNMIAWWGWKPSRGQLCCSLEFRRK